MTVRSFVKRILASSPVIDGLFRRIVWSRVHFPEVEMRYLNSLHRGAIDVAVDVGAATGSYAWILNRKSRLVICYEPGNVHSRMLESVSFGTRIRVVRAAVGDTNGVAEMYTPGFDSNALHSATLNRNNPVVNQPSTQVRKVKQVTLDSQFDKEIAPGRRVDVVKIDVEGHELEVFRGAQKLIAHHHPLIFCEIEKRHNMNYAAVFGLMRSMGYTSYVFRGGRYLRFDGIEIGHLQTEAALAARLRGDYDLKSNAYTNNFVFQHSKSRIKVVQ